VKVTVNGGMRKGKRTSETKGKIRGGMKRK
jgi:hypothetical protein